MKGQTKKPKTPGEYRKVLAQNLRLLMEEKYRDSPNKPRSMAAEAGVSFSTVQRVLDQSAGATIDTLESLASVFELSVAEIVGGVESHAQKPALTGMPVSGDMLLAQIAGMLHPIGITLDDLGVQRDKAAALINARLKPTNQDAGARFARELRGNKTKKNRAGGTVER